jgi:hypothetical protein
MKKKTELEVEEWLFDLEVLAKWYEPWDCKCKNKCIAEMMNTVSSFKSKFELMMTDLTNNASDHFPNMQDHLILFFR